MLLIECKTEKYRDDSESEIAYKIDSLGQDVRGLFGETWLVSARTPTDTLNARARQAKIRVFGPADLPDLREAVLLWKAETSGA